MKTPSEYLRSFRERRIKKREESIKRVADSLFQIREYNSELWLTYNGNLVMPTSMLFGDDLLFALQEIRRLYVLRNTNTHD